MNYPEFVSKFSADWCNAGLFGDGSAALDEFDVPEIIEIEPIHFCNLNCIMCHVHFEPSMSRTKLDLNLVADRLAIPDLAGKWALIASGYEGTAHPDFAPFVNALTDHGMKIEMTTNGTLLTDKLISQIADCNFKFVTFSFDGSRKETYEQIRQGGNFERSVERIENFIRSRAGTGTYLNVNHTTMRCNIDEIPDTVRFWDDRDIDQIFFIGMRERPAEGVHRDETIAGHVDDVVRKLDEAAEMVINEQRRITLASPFFLKSGIGERHPDALFHHVVKSSNPEARIGLNPRSFYQNGDYPGMPVSCRSPFKFARINYTGDVFLCQRFIIGNIYERPFLDIWNGEKAKRVREEILGDGSPCLDCDHYKLCVKADELDVDDPEALIQTMPQNIGEFLDYSIIKHGGRFYGVPISAVYEDLSPVAGATFVGDDVETVIDDISRQAFGAKQSA